MPHTVIATDGYRSHSGESAWAFVAHGDLHGTSRHGELHEASSLLAEWVAVAEALRWAERELVPGETAELRTDSALVAKGLASRRPQMSGEVAELRANCRKALARLAEQGIRVRVRRIPRALNLEADAEARRALGEGNTVREDD